MWVLTAVQHAVHFRRVWLVIHDLAIDFDPGMRLEWELLSAQDHLCTDAILLEQTSGSGGSLQAEGLFPVPDARHVNRIADFLGCARSRRFSSEGVFAHLIVKGHKISAGQVKVEHYQLQICSK